MKKKMFSKNYNILLFGNAISDFGDILYSVAIGYWVYDKTNSIALMGIISSISMFVQMFLLPISGTIIDRINRKNVIIIADIIRGILMIGCGILAIYNNLNIPIVLFVALIASFCSLFFNPAIDTIIIDLLDKDNIVRGQSIFSAVNSFISLTSKAISGILIALIGVGWIIIINGLSFILSAISEMFIKLEKREKQNVNISFRIIINDLKDGFNALIKNKHLRFFMSIALIINLLGSGAGSIYLAWFLDIGFDIEMYGFISAIQTFAYLLGTLFLSVTNLSNKQTYSLFKCGFIISSICSIFMYGSKNIFVISILSIIVSLTSVIANSIFSAKIMIKIPDDSKGSIIGLFSTCTIGGAAISSVLYGFLSEYISTTYVFIGLSIITLIPLFIMVFNSKTKEFIYN